MNSKPKYNRKKYVELRDQLKNKKIHTVCIGANCPNRYECFSENTATFLILGDKCTRDCKYCNIQKGKPVYSEKEPKIIAQIVKKLNLKYVVITSVTRDDLKDGGASVFIECVKQIKKIDPKIKIELLIPDLNGNWEALKSITEQDIHILNHNIETVEKLFKDLRPDADYQRSLELLKQAKLFNPYLKTKSGLMLGLGESKQDVVNTMNDLRNMGVDYLSLGQYLAPSKNHTPVKKNYTQEEFDGLKTIAMNFGFKHVLAGPLVRSSYHASNYIDSNKK